MCTGTEIMIGAMVAGTMVSAYSAVQNGQQAKKQADYQRKMAENNAAIAEQNRRDAINSTISAEQAKRMEVNQRTASIRAEFGASGVDVGSGSPLDHIADSAMIGEMDVQNVHNAGLSRANGFAQQAADFNSQADLYGMAGKNALSSSYLSAGGTLLTGFANAAFAGNQLGMWGKSGGMGASTLDAGTPISSNVMVS